MAIALGGSWEKFPVFDVGYPKETDPVCVDCSEPFPGPSGLCLECFRERLSRHAEIMMLFSTIKYQKEASA